MDKGRTNPLTKADQVLVYIIDVGEPHDNRICSSFHSISGQFVMGFLFDSNFPISYQYIVWRD